MSGRCSAKRSQIRDDGELTSQTGGSAARVFEAFFGPVMEGNVIDKQDAQTNKLLVWVIPIAVAVAFSLWLMGVFG